MKSKIVGIMVIVALLVAMLGVAVNAAEVKVAPDTIKVGDTVTVSVPLTDVANFSLVLTYDTNTFEFVGINGGAFANPTVNTKTAGTIRAAAAAADKTSTTVTYTFKALKATDSANFNVTDRMKNETAEATVKVNEVTPEPTPEENTTPADNTTTENTSKDNNTKPATENKTTNNGSRTDAATKNTGKTETPTTTGKKVLPQTGAPVYAYVLGIVAIAGVATLVAKKNNK